MWIQKLLSFNKFFISKKKSSGQVGFLNLYKPALGPIIELTPEQKKLINQQIDRKMQQLERTGLSRQEILLSNTKKGIPLVSDPFFQFLKTNYLARQIYIKAGERYSVEKVIQIALRQDIGPDPSYARIRQLNPRIENTLSLDKYDEIKPLEDTKFNPDSYFASHTPNTKRLKDQLKPVQSIRYIYKPLEKYQKMKLKTRQLRSYDIHWRNVELLTQFLNKQGGIKNRFATCLPIIQHKKVENAINAARSMQLLPYHGFPSPILNRNLRSLQQQVNQIGRKQINLETGHLYIYREKSVDHQQRQKFLQNDPDTRYEKMMKQGPTYKLWLDSLKQQLLDPNFEQNEKAQLYARKLKQKQLKLKGINIDEASNIYVSQLERRLGVRRSKRTQIPVQSEPQYQKIYEKKQQQLKNKLNENIYTLADIMVKQKTL